MSALWPKATPENPCPICGKHDWCCRFGDKKMLCMRVQSDHAATDGGYYHDYAGQRPAYIGPARVAPRRINLQAVSKDFNFNTVDVLAKQLGVTALSLQSLGAAWSPQEMAWVFPMKDGNGNVIGFRTRHPDGSKKAITGSQGGLFVPDIEPENVAYLPEGPTDTAALLTMGFYAVGRPSCNSGTEQLRILLKRLKISRVVVISDNDEEKTKPNGEKWRPGLEGAKKLKKDLGLMSVLYMPSGVKDVRKLLNTVGLETARKMIQTSVLLKVWTRV